MNKILIPSRTFFRIGDVAKILSVKPYVIRFWEGEFPFLAPDKADSGQRVYRRPQIEALVLVKHLLHVERYSIEGAKKKLTELRKQARLKDAMLALVQNEGSEEAAHEALETTLAPGSVVSKSELSAFEEKLSELQTLIRDPESKGLGVPGLKHQ